MTSWQKWLQHPERSWLRHAVFQIHLWAGAGISAYVLLMSITGSVIVYRNLLSKHSIEWLVNFHANLASGPTGRLVNGMGAIGLTALCLTGAIIWWPGIRNWRRSLTVNWQSKFSRFTWDLHSALGFWCFLLLLEWGVSAIYFSFPRLFDSLFLLDPADRFTD